MTIAALRARYPASRTDAPEDTDLRLELLCEDTAHVPLKWLDAGCRLAARSCQFMPPAAKLIELAREARDAAKTPGSRTVENQRRLWDANNALRGEGRSVRWQSEGIGSWSLYDLRETPNRADPCEGARP